MEHFKQLSFVPLPLLNGEKYSSFADLYGKDVDERDCPSSKPAPQGAEADNRRKSILVSSKVRGIMTSHECFKPRCIYSKAKLTKDEQIALKRVQESQLYTCCSSIFHPLLLVMILFVLEKVLHVVILLSSPISLQH